MNLQKKININFALLFSLLIVLASVADAAETLDPSFNGFGARVLSLGKAYVGMADDANAILLNPAGLAQIKGWQLTSLSSKFLTDVSYQQLGLVIPSSWGSFGISYTGGSVSTTVTGTGRETGPDGRIIATGEALTFSEGNQAVLLSYGNRLPWIPLSLGVTGKIFGASNSATGLAAATANGFEMDLGALYQIKDWLRLGVSAQDLLPSSLNGNMGKLSWNDGTHDTYPAILRSGVSVGIVGRKGLWQRGVQELSWNLDSEYRPTSSGRANLLHSGVEWSPLELVALRLGLDQDQSVGDGTIYNNLAAGVGLQLNNFRFDYAYHQYNGVSELATHYFSFTLGLPNKVDLVAGQAVRILDPLNKFKTNQTEIKMSGTILNKAVASITANGVVAEILDKGYFNVTVPLVPGRNEIKIVTYDKKGTVVGTQSLLGVRWLTFKDIDATSWAKDPVEYLRTVNLMLGYPDGTVRIDPEITRAEFATLLVRFSGLELSASGTEYFSDVSPTFWAKDSIDTAVRGRLMRGVGGRNFDPEGNISRAAAIASLVKLVNLEEFPVTESPYTDVPTNYWAVKEISAAKQAGLLKFVTEKEFQPGKSITRGEVAYILSATPQMVQKINSVMDFDPKE